MNKPFHACLIAATHSSAGKTTWALALMALAKKKGLAIQPFKAGPDYIDPSFHHKIASPRRSRNLDLFFLSKDQIKETFQKKSAGADLAVVEGMMGLFDGRGPEGEEGSSAELAKLLGLPVFLVLEAGGMATSAAAIVLGFQKFDPALNLVGIFFNRVSHPGHFEWLKRVVEKKTGIPCLGYLPEEKALHIPERHLGLTTAAEMQDALQKIELAANLLEPRLDWERFWELAQTSILSSVLSFPRKRESNTGSPIKTFGDDIPHPCRIGIASDTAFSFYYEDNLDLLKEEGAELVFFSPLQDESLPEDLDLLYFGGGFPEIYAEKLSGHQKMISGIREFYRSGGFIYGECGGFIYLTEAFRDSKGCEHPLVGLISGKIQMTNQLQHFGYHELTAEADTFLFPEGMKLRSHEFHYSTWEGAGENQAAYRIGERREGIVLPRLLASYQHLHFGFDPALAKNLVRKCVKKGDRSIDLSPFYTNGTSKSSLSPFP